MSTTHRITRSILQAYYGTVTDLQSYISGLLGFQKQSDVIELLLRQNDPSPFKDFLTQTFVALPEASLGVDKPHMKAAEPMVRMSEVIDRALVKLVPKRVKNVLTEGYKQSKQDNDRGKRGMTRIAVSNYYVNTIVTALQSSEWERLLKRVGEDVILHLLTETSIFVALPNDCLCQVTGDMILHRRPSDVQLNDLLEDPFATPHHPNANLKRHLAEDPATEPPRKRARVARQPSAKPDQTRKPVDIIIPRMRLFYARPDYVPHTTKIIAGHPPKHILNIMSPSSLSKRGDQKQELPYELPDPRKQMDNARLLSKYVFPRQYGLASVFTLDPWIVQSQQGPTYADRTEEIKACCYRKGPCKTPTRVKPVLALLEKMIWMNGKCKPKALRDLACPSKLKDENQQKLDDSVILELMSEHSIIMPSQLSSNPADVSLVSATRIAPGEPIQGSGTVKSKPRFAEFACSYAQVFRYAVLMTKAVFPKAIWGTDSNFKLVMQRVKEFITYRRYENITLHQIIQGLKTSNFSWLGLSPTSGHVPVSDLLKRRELLEDFLFWYFSSFLLPLLRTTFYVTESSAFRNRILYFRQDDWNTLCAPLIERLSADTFQKLDEEEAEEIIRQRKLGFSFVRLLPKETGVRPIVNLRRKKTQSSGSGSRSVNEILEATFKILSYEKEAQPALLGSSVFGPNEVYGQLKAFKSRLAFDSPDGKLPKLYFVKVDVQACFDTIDQTKLLSILRDLIISEDSYLLQRYGQIAPKAGKIRRQYIKKALPDDEHPHFLQYAAQLAGLLKNVIFVDQVVYHTSSKAEVLELLEEHITENMVKIGQDYYRQVVGIPQGSVLSALLCSFFYGDLERNLLKFTQDPGSVLLRLIDDYLFITTDLSKARRFLEVMNRGHPEYGCFISRDKTLTNFDHDTQITNIIEPKQGPFPWCGFLIDTLDLSVRADYMRYNDTYTVDSLTVDRGRKAGATFLHKMLQLAKARSHIIYCDTDLNSSHTIHVNIYQNFLLVAMKMHHYLKAWGVLGKLGTSKVKGSSYGFVYDTINQVIRYTYSTIRQKATNRVAITSGARCEIQKQAVIWLGLKAFHTVFSQRPTSYQALIRKLHFELQLGKNRQYASRLKVVAKEGLEGMVKLSF